MLSLLLLVVVLVQENSLGTKGASDRFEAVTIDDNVAIGYGVAIGDVDGDGKQDILLADQKQFVWYQNPKWIRHVMVEDLTKFDNVCIAVRDIDGDGKVEVAVGAQWNPGDTNHSGSVHYLVPPEDRTKKWTPIALHNEPVVHRMRWVQTAEKEFVLVVVPLHGRGNTNGNGEGVRLLAYQIPAKPESDTWETTLLDDQLHVTHNFDVGHWDATDSAASGDASNPESSEHIAYLGKEGALLIHKNAEGWQKRPIPTIEGGGEIRFGKFSTKHRFMATIEPFHGDKLVVYEFAPNDDTKVKRTVVNPNLSQGHALATGDFLQNGSNQVIVGWREPNEEGKVGIKMHLFSQKEGKWSEQWIDDNKMACEDLQVADLDADGDLDIVAAGRSTHNLKVYWNQVNR